MESRNASVRPSPLGIHFNRLRSTSPELTGICIARRRKIQILLPVISMARRTPSFNGLSPASPTASLAKRRNCRRDTLHEVILRRELWRAGLRFRKNVESMPGKPDIVFPSAKLIVFCDGDFWHGRNWPAVKPKLAAGPGCLAGFSQSVS